MINWAANNISDQIKTQIWEHLISSTDPLTIKALSNREKKFKLATILNNIEKKLTKKIKWEWNQFTTELFNTLLVTEFIL